MALSTRKARRASAGWGAAKQLACQSRGHRTADLAQAPTLGVKGSGTLNIHRATVTSLSPDRLPPSDIGNAAT